MHSEDSVSCLYASGLCKEHLLRLLFSLLLLLSALYACYGAMSEPLLSVLCMYSVVHHMYGVVEVKTPPESEKSYM